MNRMHPGDMRAKLAMKFVELYAKHGMNVPSIENAVHDADTLLAVLERTAKPEPDTKDAATIALKARLDNAIARAENAEACVKELEANNQSLDRAADVLIEERISDGRL